MSSAFRCDKCGFLFERKEQNISVEFKKSKAGQSYITIAVARGFDLCKECVGVALDKAIVIHKKK